MSMEMIVWTLKLLLLAVFCYVAYGMGVRFWLEKVEKKAYEEHAQNLLYMGVGDKARRGMNIFLETRNAIKLRVGRIGNLVAIAVNAIGIAVIAVLRYTDWFEVSEERRLEIMSALLCIILLTAVIAIKNGLCDYVSHVRILKFVECLSVDEYQFESDPDPAQHYVVRDVLRARECKNVPELEKREGEYFFLLTRKRLLTADTETRILPIGRLDGKAL